MLQLAIVIPTYNEQANVGPLVEKINAALGSINWEIIFVDDDSNDGTPEKLQTLALNDSRVRYIRRVGRRGLSSACIEGMSSTCAPVIAVMDADLQHDERILPEMLRELSTNNYDIVVGSRYVAGAGISKEWTWFRQFISLFATWLGKRIARCEILDPMSGFFMLKREIHWQTIHQLSGKGFKILLDILASSPKPIHVKEVPFGFRVRVAGESKLDSNVINDFLFLLLDKTIGAIIPIRFILFTTVGGIGALLHLSVLLTCMQIFHKDFWVSQAIASTGAMLLNFSINNILTYSNRRLKGADFIEGVILFILICSVGAYTNVLLAQYLFQHKTAWWIAGLVGAMIGSVWNYSVSTQIVWRKKSKRKRQCDVHTVF